MAETGGNSEEPAGFDKFQHIEIWSAREIERPEKVEGVKPEITIFDTFKICPQGKNRANSDFYQPPNH
jgi:hypothetical protein